MKRDSKARGGQKDGEQGVIEYASPARRRTLARMRRLLAAGVAAGGLGSGVGCGEVCDPLPPPLECAEASGTHEFLECYSSSCVQWSAAWARLDQQLVAQVDLQLVLMPEQAVLELTGDPQLQGGELVDFSRQPDALSLRCRPDEGVVAVDVRLALSCDGLAKELRFRLHVSGTPAEGGEIPITPID